MPEANIYAFIVTVIVLAVLAGVLWLAETMSRRRYKKQKKRANEENRPPD